MIFVTSNMQTEIGDTEGKEDKEWLFDYRLKIKVIKDGETTIFIARLIENPHDDEEGTFAVAKAQGDEFDFDDYVYARKCKISKFMFDTCLYDFLDDLDGRKM